jgi:hypothetical protein
VGVDIGVLGGEIVLSASSRGTLGVFGGSRACFEEADTVLVGWQDDEGFDFMCWDEVGTRLHGVGIGLIGLDNEDEVLARLDGL